MSNITNFNFRGADVRTMTSREIAELVEARHNDVVATIERLFSKGLLRSSRETRRESTGGRPLDVYDLIERDTHLVVSGYSDEHRAMLSELGGTPAEFSADLPDAYGRLQRGKA